MNAILSLVRMEPSVKMGLMPISVSVYLDFKATTVTWTLMSVPPDPVKTMAHVWMMWIITDVTVIQVSEVRLYVRYVNKLL